MRINIYEYPDGTNRFFKDTLVRDYDGTGCWELEVEMPDILNPYPLKMGGFAIEPPKGFSEMLSDCLSNENGKPHIKWTDEFNETHSCLLKILSRKERSTSLCL